MLSTGPMEHSATRPKESSWASLLALTFATPMPRARMKGTVIGPVVTPPESKAMGTNSGLISTPSANTSPYSPSSIHLSFHRNRMRSSAITRNRPTPTATVRISARFGTPCTWLARTVRSGSAMVISNPTAKATITRNLTFFFRVSIAPMWVPMGSMAVSAPRVNNPMPTTSSAAPKRNRLMVLRSMGTKIRLITSTSSEMGSTEETASSVFSLSFLLVVFFSGTSRSVGVV